MNRNAVLYLRFSSWIAALFLVFAAVGMWESAATAQIANPDPAAADNTPKDDTTPAEPDEASSQPLAYLIVKSGAFSIAFYVVLAIFSLVALSIALERIVNLRREKLLPNTFIDGLKNLVSRDTATAEDFRSLSETSPSPIARILKAGVIRAGRSLPEVEKSMEDAAAREMASLRSHNRPLTVIGNVAPLVGLLGTVVGMIFAFSTASQTGLGKAEELAKGIYLALLTTAIGLTIAIPSMLAAAWFSGRGEKFMREIDESLLETMPSFAHMENRIVSARRPAPVERETEMETV